MYFLQSLVLVSILNIVAPISAATSKNAFFNPSPLRSTSAQSPTLSYAASQVLNISWTTTYSSIDLLLWQAGRDETYSRLFASRTSGSPYYLWPIDVSTFSTSGTNSTTGVSYNVFNLVMYQTGNADGTESFSSQYFSVTGEDEFAASSAGPATTTYTAMATSTSTATAFPTAVGVADSTGDNHWQISLGLGLGLGLGIPLLITVACLAYMLGRRRNRQATEAARQQGHQGPQAAQGQHSQLFGVPGYSSMLQPQAQQQHQAQPAAQPAFIEHYGPQGQAGAQQTQQPVYTEHFGGQGAQQQVQQLPVQQEQPRMQPIVTAKYQ